MSPTIHSSSMVLLTVVYDLDGLSRLEDGEGLLCGCNLGNILRLDASEGGFCAIGFTGDLEGVSWHL